MNKTTAISLLVLGVFFGVDLGTENAVLVDLSRTQLVERNFDMVKTIKEEQCLTEAIYYEAGNQGELGKEAVALVILNRVGTPHRPKTICGVTRQAMIVEERMVCQFSFWCEDKRKPNAARWKESQEIAHRVLTSFWHRAIITQYQRAVYFHADYVKPQWRNTKVFLGKIDNHLFYGEPHDD